MRARDCHPPGWRGATLRGLLVCAGVLGAAVPIAQAWDPYSNNPKYVDPGSYRAGEIAPYEAQAPAYPRQDTTDWYSSESAQADRYYQAPWPTSSEQRRIPDTWRPDEYQGSDGYPLDPAAVYRFRGQDARAAPTPTWTDPELQGDDLGNYRFREDDRLKARQPGTADGTQYRFRPLDP
ncbi:hypothetical protein [Rhabdochromatium marinum]|uniref:hypothetical protein n=1 Tax=Rhabdochromatium marinum TaxID=48729 RepID=UPI001907D9EE|nr:hypothetical protein [Rhabdochromatium marinum]MBK1647088.1 hypothetical protein [Rhabdochromatium marinum]